MTQTFVPISGTGRDPAQANSALTKVLTSLQARHPGKPVKITGLFISTTLSTWSHYAHNVTATYVATAMAVIVDENADPPQAGLKD